MNTTIPAVQTRYNQRHYRSRLEARWAVFFDVLGLPFEYEPEKFQVSANRRYIPDFWLPTIGGLDRKRGFEPCGGFLEVKGKPPTAEEIRVAAAISSFDRSAYIAHGTQFSKAVACLNPILSDGPTWDCSFCQCPFCGRFGFGWEPGPDEQNPKFSQFHHICFEEGDFARNFDILDHFAQDINIPRSSPAIAIAQEAALSARFESPEWASELEGTILAVKRLTQQKVFCGPDVTTWISLQASEWKSVKEPWMKFSEPWWFQHRRDLGKAQCSCYSCRSEFRGVHV